MKRVRLLKHLARHGCELLREGGNHTMVIHVLSGRKSPIPRHAEVKAYTVRAICKKLRVPVPPEK